MAWFEYFTSWLKERGLEFTSPRLGRLTGIHIDDVMFMVEQEYVAEVFLPDIKACFEIAEQHVSGLEEIVQMKGDDKVDVTTQPIKLRRE